MENLDLTPALCILYPLILLVILYFGPQRIASGVWSVLAGVWSFLTRDNEPRCPQCGKAFAGQKSREKLMGIFQKGMPVGRYGADVKMVWYEKYEIYFKCRYCGHEWVLFRLEKQ